MELTERANAGLHDHLVAQAMRAKPARSATVLDIGCGTGALLRQLRQRGYANLSGVDIAPPEDFDGIRFHARDLDQPGLPFADQSIDLLLAVEIVEHLENPGLFLAEVRRLLAPDGCALITTPNVHSVEARLRFALLGQLKQFDAIGDPTHVNPVFQRPFGLLLARHALRPTRTWGFPEDGSSPTSRTALRRLATLARGFGLRGGPDGDQLCMQIAHESAADLRPSKKESLTAHYQ